MNAFEDIVKLYLEEEGYWARQSVKVSITPQEKRNIGTFSMPTPEIDIVALKVDKNELLLVEVKSFLDSPGVRFSGVSGKNKKDAKRYKLFTNDKFRKIVTCNLKEQYQHKKLVKGDTKITCALAAGHIYSTKKSDDEPKIKDYFERKGWKLFTPKQIKAKIKDLSQKGWEDNLITMTAKLTKEAIP